MYQKRAYDRTIILLLMALAVGLMGCLSNDQPSESDRSTVVATSLPQRAPVTIEAIDILQVDTFPAEASVVVRGHFPNECTSIDQISQERSNGTIIVTVDSVQSGGLTCPDNRVPFEERIDLDLVGLPAGIYVVEVNGLQGTFKLQRDNVPDEGNAVIGGHVWQDSCDVIIGDENEEIQLTSGCVDLGDGSYGGNGIRETDEPGLGGVIVRLGSEVCPSDGLASTITDAQGEFLFSGLMAGAYCLTIDDQGGQNSALLAEGVWTHPREGNGRLDVTLQPGDSRLDLDFGWTQLRRPEAPAFLSQPDVDCTNQALFVEDVTVPDDTLLNAGQPFTKTWRLQNLGSCTWGSTYSLVATAGDVMGATDSVPLTVTVPPGEVGDLSVQLVAPEVPGTYRGEWKLLSPDGFLFGIGPGSDRPFWVQIVVAGQEPVG